MRRVAGIGVAAAAVLSMAACSSNDSASSGDSSSAPAPAPASSAGSSSAAPSNGEASGDGVTTAEQVFGPACSKVPTSGEGSVGGMIDDPVATAASNNPLLTKLVAAVKATNLVDTLNSQPGITVFAPADDAFKALGDAKFKELAGKPDELAPILKYHVVGKRYDAKGLEAAKTVPTLDADGGDLKIEGSGENITVNGNPILCGNVPTKNATVFVIGKVLTPGTNK